MSESQRDVKDAPIPNSVSHEKIADSLQKNSAAVRQLVEQGALLLAETNRPNIITLAQFEPFIPLFKMDKNRYAKDRGYELEMNRLYNRWKRELEINLYEITIVIKSKEDPQEVYWLDRTFTRIQSDFVPDNGKSHRDTVPAAVARSADMTRDDQILQASLHDLMEANKTEEQMNEFFRAKMESSLVQKRFFENNLSEDLRKEILGGGDNQSGTSSTTTTTLIDDDDED